MKVKKNRQKFIIQDNLQDLLDTLNTEREATITTMDQLSKAGKYHLKFSDTDVERIDRYFRGRVMGLEFAAERIRTILIDALDNRKR